MKLVVGNNLDEEEPVRIEIAGGSKTGNVPVTVFASAHGIRVPLVRFYPDGNMYRPRGVVHGQQLNALGFQTATSGAVQMSYDRDPQD